MRYVFLIGGCLGFVLAGGTAFACDCGPERVLLDGAVGCLAGALLLRWLWSVLLNGLRESRHERHRAQAAAAEARPDTSPAKP